MKHLKPFNESNKPEPQTIRKGVTFLDYHEMMEYLENKYNFESREFSGIPSTMNRDKHFDEWCDKHGLDKKDSKGKTRQNSQEFYKMYKVAEDGERLKPPYMDFWHYLCDINDIHNGTYIHIPREVDDSDEITPESTIQMYKWMLSKELKEKNPDKEHIKNCEELIRRQEEEMKNPKVDPWKGWKQKITDLIFKEFGEYANDDYLTVFVEW